MPILDGLKEWGKVQKGLLEPIKSPDVEITEVDLPNSPIKEISSSVHVGIVAMFQVEEAMIAEEKGFDAVVLGCLDEPGVSEAKEVLQIPVVGEAESSMHYASLLGRKFSFVGGSPESKGILEDLAKKYGFFEKLASVRKINATPLDFASNRNGIIDNMIIEGEKAIERDGADSIIGYGDMDCINIMRSRLGVPVISPVQASVLMAENLVRLNISHSKKAYPFPKDILKIKKLRFRSE
tara:strand:+ start:1194 stop:1907 length:714 start_codon:yes stop_codon:yes gene_type:complete